MSFPSRRRAGFGLDTDCEAEMSTIATIALSAAALMGAVAAVGKIRRWGLARRRPAPFHRRPSGEAHVIDAERDPETGVYRVSGASRER